MRRVPMPGSFSIGVRAVRSMSAPLAPCVAVPGASRAVARRKPSQAIDKAARHYANSLRHRASRTMKPPACWPIFRAACMPTWRCSPSRAARAGRTPSDPSRMAPLGIVRTTELLAADSHYGTHQFFTRAVDPGFSKSPDRTMKIWGDQIPLEDMVRVIRIYRPQVVINGWGGVHFGHGQHQASGLLTPTAIADAADPIEIPGANHRRSSGLESFARIAPRQFPIRPNPAAALPERVAAAGERRFTALGSRATLRWAWPDTRSIVSQGTPVVLRQSVFPPAPRWYSKKASKARLLRREVARRIDLHPRRPLRAVAIGAMSSAFAAADQDFAAASKSALALDRAAAASSLAKAG